MASSITEVWTYPLLQIGMSVRNQKRELSSVDFDKTTHYKPSHLDLHCLQKYQVWIAELKESRGADTLSRVITLSKLFLLPFEKRVYSKRKEFAPLGSKFFPFRVDLFQKILGM